MQSPKNFAYPDKRIVRFGNVFHKESPSQ